MKLYLQENLKQFFDASKPLFDQLMQLGGTCYRNQDGRMTQRIQLGKKTYFIKQHRGVGWKEIFKNLLQFRLPILSAKNEWSAIQKLQQEETVATPAVVGYGVRGFNPAKLESFILMEELTPVISLEDLCKTWRDQPPSFQFKQILIKSVAEIARKLHYHGINHRDFYICHFLLDANDPKYKQQDPLIYLIDLHRAAIRKKIPLRWIIKDLAGLLFSTQEIGLTKHDFYRFIKIYRQKPLKKILKTEMKFWQKVEKRGNTYCDRTKPSA